MKKLNFALAAINSLVVLGINIGLFTGNFSLPALYFCLWAISPWCAVLIITHLINNRHFLKMLAILSLIIGGLAAAALIDIAYIHPDPQGGLAVIALPLYQWLCLLLAVPLLFYISRQNGHS